ncbi:MAG: PilZ domain-containing protein [Sphingobium sp.]
MQAKRNRVRVAVDIPVTITTVLDSQEAKLTNLSPTGAQVQGIVLPKGTTFQLDCEGYTTYAKVMWVKEGDCMGVRFPFLLSDGPLYQALQDAQSRTYRRGMPPAGLPEQKPVFAGFGRRLR